MLSPDSASDRQIGWRVSRQVRKRCDINMYQP